MQTLFTDLSLAEPILRALRDEGYEHPTPIQARAIEPIMAGRDVLGCAQTGTGKTAAFALPILHRLITTRPALRTKGARHSRVLVLSPTRELATQIAESFATYGRHTKVSGTTIFGGVGQRRQEIALSRGVDVIVATPGRLLDLTEQGIIDYSGIECLVLDEADRMLDMGFINPIRQIAAELPEQRQTLLFSATMPREIRALADSLLRDPDEISVDAVSSAAPLIEQRVMHVRKDDKPAVLAALLEDAQVARAVVFTRTKHGADRVCQRLDREGVPAVAIHGNKTQNQRERALRAFRSGQARVLVATDVAARGLDVDAITHVVNYDLPVEPEAYVHRIGRTGRAGATGIAISFCDPGERGALRDIERLTGTPIAADRDHPALAALTLRTPAEAPHAHAARRDPAPHDGRGKRRPQRGPQRASRNGSPNQPQSRNQNQGANQARNAPRAPRQGAGVGTPAPAAAKAPAATATPSVPRSQRVRRDGPFTR